jgi:DNA polymerase III sliding clamp (beta) subunit (PCNA family)
MRWTAELAALAEAVRETRGDLSAKDDILAGHVLLRARRDRLTVIGRDTFMTVSAMCAITGDADGAVCVDHRRLDDFLNHVSGEHVRATLASERLRLRVGPASFELPTHGEDILSIPKLDAREAATVGTEPTVRALRCVLPAVHDDLAHAALSGIQVTCGESGIVTEACDGKRFARAEERVDATPLVATLNRRFAAKLTSIAHHHARVVLRHDENFVAAEIGTVRLLGPKILAPFPGLGSAIDGATKSTCELERDALLEAIDTVRAIGEDEPLRLELLVGKLRLSVQSADGDAAIPLTCEVKGETAPRLVSFRNFRMACTALEFPRLSVSFVRSDLVRIAGERETGNAAWVLVCRVP